MQQVINTAEKKSLKENSKDHLNSFTEQFPVIGIGSGSGSSGEFKKLLGAIPKNSGMAYILKQDISPGNETLDSEVVQKICAVHVSELSDVTVIYPDHIYIVPYGKKLSFGEGGLKLVEHTPREKEAAPLDNFFTSLAKAFKSYSVGVISSRAITDGTEGLRAIKNYGGITFGIDEPLTALKRVSYSAVLEGVIDFILPSEQIPQKIRELTKIIASDKEQDVTEADEMVFVRQEETEYYRSLLSNIVNSSDDAIVSKSLEGIITSWNRGAQRIFGYTPLEAIGKHISILIPPYLLKEEEMIISKIKKGQQVLHYDTLRVTKDGRSVNISVTVSPIKDKDGKIIGASKIARDITEQKRAASIIKESENRYHNLVSSSPFGIAILAGPDFIITIANQPMLDIWGKGNDVFGRHYFDILPEVAEQGYREVFNTVYATGVPYSAIESPVQLMQNGELTLKYYNFVIYPQRDLQGKTEGIGIIATEVTRQAEFNKQIKQSEENFRQLAELTPEKISESDAQGKPTYFNASWVKYTGMPLEQLQKSEWKTLIYPDDRNEYRERWKHCLQTGSNFEMELRLLDKDLNYRWHFCRSVAIKNADQQVTRWITSTTEIHLQKEKNIALENFAYVVSHDLKAPLHGIANLSDWLINDYHDKLDETGRQYLDLLKSRVIKLENLINGILSYSKAANLQNDRARLDLNELVAEATELLPMTDAVKLKVNNLPVIQHSKSAMMLVFGNLIGNAIKHNDKEVAEIEVGVEEDEEHFKFYVRDNGPGIKEGYHEKVFNIFESLKNKTVVDTSGIGLSIVKKIIENDGGRIWIVSPPGEGATFLFTIKK